MGHILPHVRRAAARCVGLLLVLAAGAPAWAQAPAAPPDPASEQSDAYVALVLADQSRGDKDYARAVLGYRDALDRYNRLATSFPDWQSDVIRYRQAYCANQIEAIVRVTGKSEASWLSAAVKADAAGQDDLLRQRYASLLQENEYVHQRLLELQGTAEAAAAGTNTLAEENRRLQAENGRLLAELQRAPTNPPAAAGLTAREQERLQAAQEELRQQVKRLQQREEAAQRDLAAQARATDAVRTNLEYRLQQAHAEQAAALEALRTGQKKREQEQVRRLQQLQADLDTARETLRARDRAAAAATERLAGLTQQLARVEAEAKASADAQAELDRQLAERGRQTADLEQQAAAAAAQRDALQAKADRQAEQLKKAREDHRNAQSELERLRAEQQAAAERERQAAEHHAALKGELAAARARLEQYAEEAQFHTQRLADVVAEMIGQREEVEAARRQAETAAAAGAGRDMQRARWKEGLAFERAGAFSNALAVYEGLLGEDPADREAIKAKARCLLNLGYVTPALDLLREGARRGPPDRQLQMLLGVAYCRSEQFEEAVRLLREVVRDEPANHAARSVLGAALLGGGQLPEARTELEQVVRDAPELADAQFNLAQVYCFGKPPDKEQARAHYERARALGTPADPLFEKALQEP